MGVALNFFERELKNISIFAVRSPFKVEAGGVWDRIKNFQLELEQAKIPQAPNRINNIYFHFKHFLKMDFNT